MKLYSKLLLLFLVVGLVSAEPSQAGICDWLLTRLQHGIAVGNPLRALRSEFPDIDSYYSADVQVAAIKSHLAYSQDWVPVIPAGTSVLKNLQPFLDIENAVANIASRKPFSPEAFGNQMSGWLQTPELIPFLYTQLPRFGKEGSALLNWLVKNHDGFKGAYRDGNVPTGLLTFAFEKETHNPIAMQWFKVKGMSEKKWNSLTPEQRLKVATSKSWKGQPRSMEKTSRAPGFVGKPHWELQMLGADGNFNEGQAPLEFPHKRFEVSLPRVFSQMRQVRDEFKEEHPFHLHMVFSFPVNDLPQFTNLGKWWKKINSYSFLLGLENGMHPNALTKLPTLPLTQMSQLDDPSESKYMGVGLRWKIYGKAPDGQVLLGIELRDTSPNLESMEKLAKRVAQGLSDRVWNASMEYETETLPLLPSSFSLRERFRDALEEMGVPRSEVNKALEAEPNLTLAMESFEVLRQVPGWKADDEELFSRERKKFLEDIKATILERRAYAAKGELVDRELFEYALRVSLTQWARATRPSRFYSDF